MPTGLPTLLYLGLYLGQSTQAQDGNLPRPHITAQPGPIVLLKNAVTILCHGPPEAEAYKIHKVRSPEPVDGRISQLPTTSNSLSIPEMTTDKAGLYHCSYQSGGRWSELSDPLQLVMTGAYEEPSLSNTISTRDNVKLRCSSKLKFNVFILVNEDGVHSTSQDSGQQAIFHVDRVTSTQNRTYRCYGAFKDSLYVWSHPLQLVGEEAPDCPVPRESRPLPVLPPNQSQKHQPFLIGVTGAVTFLLLLLLLLFFILRHPKAKNNATKTDRQPEAAEPMDGQAYEAIDPKEVTYSQVTCSVHTQGTAATLSLPRQTQTSEYATLALR